MERKLPKNIRQIGNVSDNPKVYVEDYVDTFISQISDKALESPVGAFLIGETFRKEEQDYIFIHGAVQMEDVSMKGNEVVLGERTWKKACEQGKRYFAGNTILGWVLIAPNQQLKLNTNMIKIHERLFMKKSRVLMMKDSVDKEETLFVYKYNDLMEIGGHYIYYEKNPEMQEYMIANRKQNCVTPSESYEDRVTKDFRSVINKKNEEQRSKREGQKSYAVSVALVLIVFVMGVSSLNNYQNLNAVQAAMKNMLSKVVGGNNQMEEIEELVEEKIEETYIVTGANVESLNQQMESDKSLDEVYENEDDGGGTQEELQEEMVQEEFQEEVIQEEMAQGDTTSMLDINEYVVQKNDTLVSICRNLYGDTSMISEICEINSLEDSDYICAGQVLRLP